MSSYHSDELREAADVLDSYVELEHDLISLAGFNLRTLIDNTSDRSIPSLNDYIIERYVPVQPSDAAYDNSSCKFCSNNPKNGGSGVCHCILGQQAIW